MQSHSNQKNTRTSPPITRQASKTRHQSQTTSQKYRKTPPLINTSTPTQTLVPHSQANQEMASEPSRSETNLLDNDVNMDVEPLSDSVTQTYQAY